MRKYGTIVIDIVIVAVVVSTFVLVYQNYGETIRQTFLSGGSIGIFVDKVPLTVRVADDEAKRSQGLSGVQKLAEDEGMLFIFDQEGKYLFWMKDMRFAIDIFWIDNNLRVVHIEKNVRPESYPARYGSPVPARFVLETNAFFADTFRLTVGDTVTIPAHWLPLDLRNK